MSMAARTVPNAGSLWKRFRQTQAIRVTAFIEKSEKARSGPGKCGVYFQRAILQQIPRGPASLEKDIFPICCRVAFTLSSKGGMFIDNRHA